MSNKVPNTSFSTRLSGSAKETELRLRSIFQWKKKRPPVVLIILAALVVLLCFSLFSCVAEEAEQDEQNHIAENTVSPDESPEDGKQGEVTVAPIDGETLSPDGAYEVRLSGVIEGVSTDGLAAAEFVQICDSQTGNVLWQGDGAYEHSVVWSPNGKRVALAQTARTGCTVTIVETIGWTAWNVELPEYTYLPDHKNWIAWTGSTEFRLTLGRGGDAGEEITYDFSPEDFPVAGTPEVSADTQAVLDYLDNLLANGRMAMWCYLLPGTGPISASLDGYYEQVREVFARYNWTKAEEAPSSMPYTAETWELWLADNYICKVDAWSNSNYVVFGYNAVDGSEKAVGYFYDGEPGSLNAALANLWSGPEFRYALVLLPVNGQDDQVLMEAYETKFRETYLNSGAIDDYKLHELELISVGEVVGGSQSPFFLMNYSIKPSDTSEPCWKNYTVGEDGWVDISVEVDLSLTRYENSETVWRCGFWQLPSKRD